MTDLPFHDGQESPATRNGARGRDGKCRRHEWYDERWHAYEENGRTLIHVAGDGHVTPCHEVRLCRRCHHVSGLAVSRRGRANRSRGNRAELAVARMIPGARKMGPLGLPWDVEVGTYARLQVKKLVSRPSLAEIARLIRAIPDTGDRLRGFVWVEAAGRGKRGAVRVWFGIVEFAKWHGLESPGITNHWGTNLISMPLAEWVAEFVGTP